MTRRHTAHTAKTAAAALLLATTLASCSTAAATQATGGPPPSASPSSAAAARRLPAVRLPPLDGGAPVNLAGLTGTPTVVLLWGSYCVPCQREMPYFDALAAAAGGRLRLLGVDTVDTRGSARSFATAVGMRFPSVFDPEGVVLRDLRLLGPPATVFVDPAGTIVHIQPGEFTSAAALRADVAEYLHVQA